MRAKGADANLKSPQTIAAFYGATVRTPSAPFAAISIPAMGVLLRDPPVQTTMATPLVAAAWLDPIMRPMVIGMATRKGPLEILFSVVNSANGPISDTGHIACY